MSSLRRRLVWIVCVIVPLICMEMRSAGSQESCANLQRQLQVLRSSGGAGSNWDRFIQQRMNELGCFGRPGQPQLPTQRRCPDETSYCATNNRCCNPGFICTKFGCIEDGSIDCGTYACGPATKCGRNGGCVPWDANECGEGKFCPAGKVCSKSGEFCLAEGDDDCGTYICDAGTKCAKGGGCVSTDAIKCGDGYCKSGYRCIKKQCVTRKEATAFRRIRNFIKRQYGDFAERAAMELTGSALKRSGLTGDLPLSMSLKNKSEQMAPWRPLPSSFSDDPFKASIPARTPGPPVDPFTLEPVVPDAPPVDRGVPDSKHLLPGRGKPGEGPPPCSINRKTYQFVCTSTFRR